jgi:hypothetical protein
LVPLQEPPLHVERRDKAGRYDPTRHGAEQCQQAWPSQDSLAALALDLANVKPLFFQFTTGEKKQLSVERTKLL